MRALLTKVNDELDDLETSDPLLPPNADATSALEVIPIHDDVNSQVQGDGNPRDRGRANELSVAEESSSTVVVAVEEGCRHKEISHVAASGFPSQLRINILNGFFFKKRKTVSNNSRYLVR